VSAVIALICVHARPAAAQTSLQIPLQFDFINPGAKSLSMAGAFAGVADDATAAFANPAGLTLLEGPEVSAELRGTRVVTPFLAGGRTSGTVTNIGVDTVAGPRFADSVGAHAGLSYLSVVYPHASRQWVVAGYRHEAARIDQRFSSDGAIAQDITEITSRRDFVQDVDRKVSITAYGVSGAYKATSALSLGAGIAAYTFNIDSVVDRFLTDGFFGPRTPGALGQHATQRGDDVSWAPTFGATFDRGRVRVGAVYRGGPTFRYDTITDGQADQDLGVPFRVPHTFAVGASVRAASGMLISAEVTRVMYSRLKDFADVQSRGQPDNFHVDDGTELHGSVQIPWRRPNGPPIRLRAGAWYDPDHSVKFAPVIPATTPLDRVRYEWVAAGLSNGKSQVHATGGLGMTLSDRIELNVGVDLSSRHQLAAASFILHLKRNTP
jgi:long-subunit fatty acid transport protein